MIYLVEHNEFKKYIDKEFIKGMIKLIVLNNIQKNNSHPYAILKKIKSNKYINLNVTKNDVYNVISSMEKDGLIKCKGFDTSKTHKKFIVTSKGKSITNRSKTIIIDHIKALKKLTDELNE